ncbi:MAG: hypothetical protein AAFX53_10510 [Bacteroidota bacterium]
MTRIITILLFVNSLALYPQGAWTQAKNTSYIQLSFYSISGYEELFANPDRDTEREISDNTLQLYGEYGLTDATTLIVNVPFKFLRSGRLNLQEFRMPFSEEGSRTALGNIGLGVKHRLLNDKWVLSAQLNVETNTSTFFEEEALRSGYDTWTIAPRLNVGRSFDRMFVQAYTGVDTRFNGYSSNFRLGADFGILPLDRLWVIAFMDSSVSFQNGDIVLPPGNLLNGLYVNDQEFLAVGLKGIFEITDALGLMAGFTGAASGNNVPKRGVLGFGVFGKF